MHIKSWPIALAKNQLHMTDTVKHILFPTDFSEAAQSAFVHALMLTRALGSKLTLLHVIYPEYEALDLPVMAAQATQEKVEAARAALESFRDLGLAKLREVAGDGAEPDIALDTEIGSAAAVIARIVRRDQIDLIVIGTRGTHTALERAFGSVSTGVIERAHCPVWVVPESVEYHPPRNVLYATDFEEPGPEPLREAARVLRPFQVDLHIAHVRKAGVDVEQADFTGWENYLDADTDMASLSFHERLGESVEAALVALIEELNADLMVMYSPPHGFLERIFGTSHTKHMAWKTTIPLLVVKGDQ